METLNAQGTSFRDIWSVSWPVISGGVSMTVINITDTLFLSRVSETALAASVLAGVYFLVLFMAGLGFCQGIQILVARRMGEKNEEGIGAVFTHGVFILVFLSLVLFTLLMASDRLLPLLISDQRILEASLEFLKFRSFGIFGIMGCVLFRSLFVGLGRTFPVFVAMGTVAILNIILNYLLVFGEMGFPEMGLGGSALSSTIAEIFGAILFLLFAIFGKQTKGIRLWNPANLNGRTFKSLISLSLPLVFQLLISIGAWFGFFLVIEKTGERNLAISNITRSVLLIQMTAGWGFFASSNSMVSNLIGQGRVKEWKLLTGRIMVLSVGISMLPLLVVLLFPMFILGLFTPDALLAQASLTSLYVVCLANLVFSWACVYLGALAGTGKTGITLLIETFAVLIYLWLLNYLAFQMDASIAVIWSTELVYWILIGGLSFVFLHFGKWKASEI